MEFEYAIRAPHRVRAVVGHSISYRGGADALAPLQKRFGGKKKRLLLCWVDSEVHLRRKGVALATACGVKLCDCDNSGQVLHHTCKFLSGL